jgi:hypothetical protein
MGAGAGCEGGLQAAGYILACALAATLLLSEVEDSDNCTVLVP